jgi:hypothetical protein
MWLLLLAFVSLSLSFASEVAWGGGIANVG